MRHLISGSLKGRKALIPRQAEVSYETGAQEGLGEHVPSISPDNQDTCDRVCWAEFRYLHVEMVAMHRGDDVKRSVSNARSQDRPRHVGPVPLDEYRLA